MDSGPHPFTFREETLPRRFGRYRLLLRLGEGGMGVVYEAEDLELQRFVALKMPRFDTDQDRRHFQNERRILARAKHKGIVDIFEAGEIDGRCYFTMPFLRGGSLSKRKDDYAGKPKEAAKLLSKLARAVHEAHLQGVYHRDLKPANILFDDENRPYVSDFGLAKDSLSESLSRTGEAKGTVQYMAPEQLSVARNPDLARVDVYGLGAVLYEVLTRSPPHEGDSSEVRQKVLHEQPQFHPRLKSRRDLETICLQCLQKNPARRYATANLLADDLDRYLRGEPVHARRTPWIERFWKLVKRHPAWTAVIVCTLAGLSGLAHSEYRRVLEREDMVKRLETENALTKSLLYESRMRDACQGLYQGKFGELSGLMRTLSAFSAERELRDFEFFHVAKRASQMSVGLPGLNPPVRQIAISPDGFSSFLRDRELIRALHDEDIGHHLWERGATAQGFLALLPRDRVATAVESVVRVWDVCTGELLELFDLSATQTAAAYSICGDLYTGGIDGAIHVHSSSQGKRTSAWQAHDGAVLSIIALGDSGGLVTCGEDGRALLWRDGGKSFSELHSGEPIHALAAFPDGETIAGAGASGAVHVWTTRRSCGEPSSRSLKVSGAALRGIAISPDGRLIAAGGDDRVIHILRVSQTGACEIPEVRWVRKLRGHNKEILCLAYTHDGRRLASGGGDGGIVWDMIEIEEDQAHDEPLSLDAGESPITGTAFHPEGDRFYTAHEDLGLYEWIVTGKSRKARVRPGRKEKLIGDAETGMLLSPDARWVVVKPGPEELQIWRTTNPGAASLLEHSQTIANAGPAAVIAFSPDARVLASVGPGDDLRTWRLEGGQWIFERSWPRPSMPRPNSGKFTLALSMDGTRAAVSNSRSDSIALWRLDARAAPPVVVDQDNESNPSLAFTPDGKFLLTSGTVAQLDFLHVETLLSGRPLPYWQYRILRHHESAIQSIAFTRLGNPVSAGANGELIFWRYHQLEDGRIIGGPSAPFRDGPSPIAAIAFSPANDFMITGGSGPDGRAFLRVWRTFTPEEIHAYGFSQ